jgi:biotin carboxylase
MPILVVSNSGHSLVPEIADGITVDFDAPGTALQTIISALDGRSVACVLATDDSCAELASRLARHCGLRHNKPESAALTQRKDLGREALSRAGCNTPEYRVVEISAACESAPGIAFPVVVKPLGLSASRGVIRADDETAFTAACRRIDALLAGTGIEGFARHHLLVESYIDGEEFAVEGFIVDGRFELLTIFDKPEPLSGPFFEETYYLTPSRLDSAQQRSLVDEVARCCRAYGLEQGPVHAEARMTADGPVLLELAARTIGGQCGQLIEFSLQQKLEEIVIRGMCGLPFESRSRPDSAGVLMIPITESGILGRVEGLTEAMRTEFVEDIEIHINPGYELVPLPEGASYLGFIFARAPDFERTYAALKSAHGKLRFVTRPNWKLESLAG